MLFKRVRNEDEIMDINHSRKITDLDVMLEKHKATIQMQIKALTLEFEEERLNKDRKLLDLDKLTNDHIRDLECRYHSATEELHKVEAKIEATKDLNEDLKDYYRSYYRRILSEKDDRISFLEDLVKTLTGKLKHKIVIVGKRKP